MVTKVEKFEGQVKCVSCEIGTQKWKSGAVVMEMVDENSWRLRITYDCGGDRTFHLNKNSLRRVICKETGCHIDVQTEDSTRDYVSVSYKPTPAYKKKIPVLLKILTDIQLGTKGPVTSKAEVGIKKSVETTPNSKSSLFTTFGSTNRASNENSANNNFTSVKSARKEVNSSPAEEKENMVFGNESPVRNNNNNSNNNSNSNTPNFLQRGTEKSRKCLSTIGFYGKASSTSTPIFQSTSPRKWLNTKRPPGLMPDPTPLKRSKLTMDKIAYSMKPKHVQPSTEPGQIQTLQGFSNLGNTCYMNSILQSLFGLDTFATDLLYNKKLQRNVLPQSLYSALVKLLHAKRQSSNDLTRKECLKRVKSAISNSAKRFLGYGQHDAHEFLCQVLDQVKEEVTKECKSTPTPNKENMGGVENKATPLNPIYGRNPISMNFEFEVMHTLTCLQCSEQVYKREQFHDISLDVPKQKNVFTPRSLQDALSLFFKAEQIDYKCEKCGHGKADVSHKITRLPRVFILHLKRYVYSQSSAKNRKMGLNVSVPIYLTMQNHCNEQTQPPYSHTMPECTTSSTIKVNTSLNDSRDETQSKRKLDYQADNFKAASTPFDPAGSPPEDDNNNKSKVGETEKRPLTLEDEDDEIARAIEMSLKEQDEREQISREEHSYGERTQDRKKMELMTFEEQMELAIEQSLLDAESSLLNEDYTTFDDVSNENDDVMNGNVINNEEHMYARSGDSRNNNNLESYDIGPESEYSSDENQRSLYSNRQNLRRSNSDSDVPNLSPEKDEIETLVRLTKSSEAPARMENLIDWESRLDGIFSTDDDDCSDELGDSNNNSSSLTKLSDSGGKRWGEKMRSVRMTIPDRVNVSSSLKEVDLLCREEIVDEYEDENSLGSSGVKSAKKTYEISDSPRKDFRRRDGRLKSDNGLKSTEREVKRKNSEENGDSSNGFDDLNKSFIETSDSENDSGKGDGANDGVNGNRNSCSCLKTDSETCEFCNRKRGVKRRIILNMEKPVQGKESSSCSSDTDSGEEHGALNGNGDSKTNDDPSKVNSHEVKPKMDLANEIPEIDESEVKDGYVELETQKMENEDLDCKKAKFDLTEEEKSFLEEDDMWMYTADKENKVPDPVVPKLSSPDEFDTDYDKPLNEVDSHVDENLDLPVIENEKGDLPYSYRLVSIVNHMGSSSSTGHYTSDVYDVKKKSWFCCDDSHVRKISEDDVKTKRERSGYIFFYMNKDILDDLSLQYAVAALDKKS